MMKHPITIHSVQDITHQVKQGDLVVLDIDDTVLLAAADKYAEKPSLLKGAAETVQYLQQQRVPVVFLTARHGQHESIRQATYDQLLQAGIEPDQLTLSADTEKVFDSDYHSYDRGVIYACKIDNRPQKGPALRQFLTSLNYTPQRIVIADDDFSELKQIHESFVDTAHHVRRYHCRPHRSIIQGFPDQNDQLPQYLTEPQHIDRMKGGGGGVWLLHYADGVKYVLKAGSQAAQMKDEIVADAIYRVLGHPVPDFAVFQSMPEGLARKLDIPRTGTFRLSQYIEQNNIQSLDTDTERQLASAFVADALIDNYDIKAKGDYSNIAVDSAGQVYRLDNGANLRFRATGGSKKDSGVVEAIEELKPYYQVNDEAITNQVQRLLNHVNEIAEALYKLNQTVDMDDGDHLIQRYLDRVVYLQNRFCPDYPLTVTHHPAEPEYTSAGTFVYSRHPENGEICVLMGQRAGHIWWGNLGGQSDEDDKDLACTAARETREESLELIDVTREELENDRYSDLVTHDSQGRPHVYRMYFLERDYLEAEQFNNRLKQATDKHQLEYNAFKWIPLQSLITAVDNPRTGEEEGQTVAYASTADQQSLALHPPFYRMLAQDEVRDKLKALAQSQAITCPQYKSLQTPLFIKERVSEQILKKTETLLELKRRQYGHDRPANKAQNGQTDIYLQMALGGQVKSQQNTQKVSEFWQQSKLLPRARIDSDTQTAMIDQFAQMLDNENLAKAHGQTVLYHAAEGKVAFLYDFFTQLRRYLTVNDPLYSRVFRAFEEYTRKFADVMELVNYFSNNQSADINNYMGNFNEKALSCNFFLFGCDDNSTSASHYLYLMNESRRPPHAKSLINYVLTAIDSPKAYVEKIAALYEQYLGHVGGRMYQIMIDNEVLDDMVYAATNMGVLHPLYLDGQCTYRPSQILPALQANPQKYSYYIHQLQARLFLHPEYINDPKRVQVHEYTRVPVAPEYYKRLQAITRRIAKSSLKNQADLTSHMQRAPVHEQLTYVLRRLGLQAKSVNVEMRLVKAIQNNDSAQLDSILSAHTDIDLARLPNPRYMRANQADSTVHVQDIIIHSGELVEYDNFMVLDNKLIEQKIWQWVFNNGYTTILIRNNMDLLAALKAIATEDKQNRLLKDIDHQLGTFIQNDHGLQLLLYELTSDAQKSWLLKKRFPDLGQQLLNKWSYQESDSLFLETLKAVDKASKRDLLQQNFGKNPNYSVIKNGSRLALLLKALQYNDLKCEVMQAIGPLTIDFFPLPAFLGDLVRELDGTDYQEDYIQMAVQQGGYHLAAVLKRFSENAQSSMLDRGFDWSRIISKADHLKEYLSVLHGKSNKQKLLQQCSQQLSLADLIINAGELAEIIQSVHYSDLQNQVMSSIQHKLTRKFFNNPHDVADLLTNLIDRQHRSAIIKAGAIRNGYYLHQTLRAVDVSAQKEIMQIIHNTMNFADIIKEFGSLGSVIGALRDQHWQFWLFERFKETLISKPLYGFYYDVDIASFYTDIMDPQQADFFLKAMVDNSERLRSVLQMTFFYLHQHIMEVVLNERPPRKLFHDGEQLLSVLETLKDHQSKAALVDKLGTDIVDYLRQDPSDNDAIVFDIPKISRLLQNLPAEEQERVIDLLGKQTEGVIQNKDDIVEIVGSFNGQANVDRFIAAICQKTGDESKAMPTNVKAITELLESAELADTSIKTSVLKALRLSPAMTNDFPAEFEHSEQIFLKFIKVCTLNASDDNELKGMATNMMFSLAGLKAMKRALEKDSQAKIEAMTTLNQIIKQSEPSVKIRLLQGLIEIGQDSDSALFIANQALDELCHTADDSQQRLQMFKGYVEPDYPVVNAASGESWAVRRIKQAQLRGLLHCYQNFEQNEALKNRDEVFQEALTNVKGELTSIQHELKESFNAQQDNWSPIIGLFSPVKSPLIRGIDDIVQKITEKGHNLQCR